MLPAGPRDTGADELADGRRGVAESDEEVQGPERESASMGRVSEEQVREAENEDAHAYEVGAVRDFPETVAGHVLDVKEQKGDGIRRTPESKEPDDTQNAHQYRIPECDVVGEQEGNINILREPERQHHLADVVLDVPAPVPAELNRVKDEEELDEAKVPALAPGFLTTKIEELT